MFSPLSSLPGSSRLSSFESRMSGFHSKNSELYALKKRAKNLMGRFNTLHVEYADWYKRKEQRFVDSVKSVQVMVPSLVPQKLTCITQLRTLYRIGRDCVGTKHPLPGGFDSMEDFFAFWERFCLLKQELITDMLVDVNEYIASVQRMREPKTKMDIDRLVMEVNSQHSEDFDFRESHNERDNLYTYKLMLCDSGFLGVVSYMPFLIKLCTRICFLMTKLYLEKE